MKKWNVSPEQLRALREIRINCQMCFDCAECPLESDVEHLPCRLMGGTGWPESWDLEGLEDRRDG